MMFIGSELQKLMDPEHAAWENFKEIIWNAAKNRKEKERNV